MRHECDVLVIGGGPAGAAAAVEASRRGLKATLVDEGHDAGGQVFRPLAPGFQPKDPRRLGSEEAAGAALRGELKASNVTRLFGQVVWLVQRGFLTQTFDADGVSTIASKAIVVATGAYERVVPMPGWTLPGVIGLGAATTLLKSQQTLPGRRMLVAGCGPLLPLVARGVLKAGGSVAAMVDLNGPGDLLGALPRILQRPDLALRGLGWMARVALAGVPIRWRHAVSAVLGSERVEAVRVVPVDEDWRPRGRGETFQADGLAIGHGLVPATEITRLLGARHDLRPEKGGWVAALDDGMRTSVTGLYVAGDGAGIAGLAAAALRGRLAGLAVGHDQGLLDAVAFEREAGPLRHELRRAQAFGEAMSALMVPKPGLLETVEADTVVCRCEDVTRREIETAIEQRAGDMNQLKAWTRCGMGPCQGRMCGETAASLLARAGNGLAPAGQWTMRPPIRPVPLAALTGDFAYGDLSLPPPAPS